MNFLLISNTYFGYKNDDISSTVTELVGFINAAASSSAAKAVPAFKMLIAVKLKIVNLTFKPLRFFSLFFTLFSTS